MDYFDRVKRVHADRATGLGLACVADAILQLGKMLSSRDKQRSHEIFADGDPRERGEVLLIPGENYIDRVGREVTFVGLNELGDAIVHFPGESDPEKQWLEGRRKLKRKVDAANDDYSLKA